MWRVDEFDIVSILEELNDDWLNSQLHLVSAFIIPPDYKAKLQLHQQPRRRSKVSDCRMLNDNNN